MTDYETTVRILRNLTAYGNTVAAMYLYLLESCPGEQRTSIIHQIHTFINGFNHQIAQVGPSEFKNATYSVPVEHVDHHPV